MTARRFLLSLFFALPVFAAAVPFAPGAGAPGDFVPGRDYTTLSAPLPTSTGDRMEVREFFFYGCSHCFNLERPLHKWLQTKPQDVEFVPTPAVLNPKWEPLARAYYVAEELKVLDKTHAALYSAIHNGNQKLFDKGPIVSFYEKIGVPRADVEAAWGSFSVNTKVRNADVLARKYMIQGTPTLAVAGKYLVPSNGDRTFAVVDYLLAQERAARARRN